VLTNATDTVRRALLALDMSPEMNVDSALDEYQRRMVTYKPVPPVEVSKGPVLENVFNDGGINMLKFPTPRWHEGDGGRYIGTGCVVIMRDPDTGKVNFGTYRVMVHDEGTLGLYITPNKTGAIIERKYWAMGKSCPVVACFGQEPVLFLGAAPFLGQKRGIPKYELVGHIRGAPVEVIREEFTGLPMPATAEIVVAGEVPPIDSESRLEGPFGEWTGYYASGTRPEPIIKVKALYHRNDPIILGNPPFRYRGVHTDFALPTAVKNDVERLTKFGVEDVLDVWDIGVPGVTVVQIKQRYPGHAMKAGMAASGEYMGRVVVVVDEDINPRDPYDVFWAIGTRCDPATTITVLEGCQSSALDPRITPERKKNGDFTSSRAIINACKPYEWIKDFPVANTASPELRRQVLNHWGHLYDEA
ncbi:MAG TPA: UbiD family decarboxylase, partial [Chloroflexota bacterium]|nr:UbiD family decarboxylase [Chloroflexota bacterium]